MRVILVAIVVAGCSVSADYGNTMFKCGSGDECPDGTVCTAGFCLAPTTTTGATACAMDVASGDQHVCAVRSDGAVWCWGRNESGELGDNTTDDSSTPVQVMLASPATAVVAGDAFTCAITSDTAVWCWGDNSYGQLGDGTTTSGKQPVMVKNLTGVTQIIAGSAHTCAIANGGVSCWGANGYGQLGDGTNNDSKFPVAVGGLTGVGAIAAGGNTSCAIANGKLSCWGDGENGQLANGANDDHNTPVAITTPADALNVSLGDDFVSVTLVDGTVWSSGDNNRGRLGDSGVEQGTNTFVKTAIGQDVTSIAAHSGHACAVDTAHAGWCWGYDYDGEFFDFDSTEHYSPISSVSSVVKMAVGEDHTCALTTQNQIVCVGYNGWGQLGDGKRTSEPTPQDTMATDATAVFAGGYETCVLHADKSTSCAGNGTSGQLGDGGQGFVDTLTPNTGFTNVVKMSQSENVSCALDAAGAVRCAGIDYYSQLGDESGYRSSIPVLVHNLPPAIDLSVGVNTGCAALGAAGAMCWGYGADGQLGTGNNEYVQGGAVKVAMPLTDAEQVAVGDSFACALTNAKTVYCWGNSYVTGMNTNAPIAIAGLTGVTQITAKSGHVCALSGTTAYCWGYNNFGQVGNGTTNSTSTPTAVLMGVSRIDAGNSHTCAIKTDNTVWCWGTNYQGQLGNGTYADSHVPVQVTALTGTPTSISAGSSHTCAVTSTGTFCWGGDIWGELAIGVSDWLTPRGVTIPCPQ
ncbi:MAG: hypothetical protein QM831_08580 [Kofleriaceae bacterium]